MDKKSFVPALPYGAYLFDFDGTLVDSMPNFVSVMLRILDERGMSYDKEIIKIITPLGCVGTARYYRELGLDEPEETIIARMHRYAIPAYRDTIPAKEGVADTLHALKAAGCSLHVLTASPHPMLDPCLKRLGLWELFDNVWSCEDFETTKSDPEIYRRAAAKIGLPVEQILFLDDNYNADRTAKEAGMAVCGVFDPTSAEYEAEIRSVSDHYIRQFSELLREEI